MPSPVGQAGRIGVFDSGVGGLTVVGELLKRFPDEKVLYVADQAHVPYGGRPLDEIRGFACGISTFLADEGCRAILMACNISSAVALDSVRESLTPLPVFGMIEAAARQAASESSRIGVLATQGTVTSGAYSRQIGRLAPDAFVKEVACPKFVPLVEAAETESESAYQAAREYLAGLRYAECDVIILGCTHYPYLLPALTQVAESQWDNLPKFVDPAISLIDDVEGILGSEPLDLLSTLLTTGDLAAFRNQIPLFLAGVDTEAGGARWRGSSLYFNES